MESTVEKSKKRIILNRKEELQSHKRYWILRRTQDVVFSLLALVVLFPFLAVIALVIFVDDPHGSPIFVQERCSRGGKLFKMYKFRTMFVDAEKYLDALLQKNEMDGPAFKMKDDPRITRVGHFLRATSIDELPQLINVFVGDMSIVGPRPALPREVEQYNDYQRQRLYVQPGLTCYWQIQPNRNEISFEDWIDLDIKYIRERSFIVDWKIIMKTVVVIFRRFGE